MVQQNTMAMGPSASIEEVHDLLTKIISGTPKPPVIALVTPPLNDNYAITTPTTASSSDIDMRAIKLFLQNRFFKAEYSSLSLDELRAKGKEVYSRYSRSRVVFFYLIVLFIYLYVRYKTITRRMI